MPPFLTNLLQRPLHLLAVLAVVVAAYVVLTHPSGPPPDPMVELFEAVRLANGIPGGVVAFGGAGDAPTVVALGVSDPVSRTPMTEAARFAPGALVVTDASEVTAEAVWRAAVERGDVTEATVRLGGAAEAFAVLVRVTDGFTAVALYNGAATDADAMGRDILAEVCRLRGLTCGAP